MRLEDSAVLHRVILKECLVSMGFPAGLDSKESDCTAGDTGNPGPIPGSRKSLEEGNGYPFQYSCLRNSMDRGAWRATVHGTAKSQTGLSH